MLSTSKPACAASIQVQTSAGQQISNEVLETVGVEDDGYPRGLTQTDMDTSLASLRAMAGEVHAATTLLRKAAGTRKRHCVIVRVHKLCVDDVTYTDLRIAGRDTAGTVQHMLTLPMLLASSMHTLAASKDNLPHR